MASGKWELKDGDLVLVDEKAAQGEQAGGSVIARNTVPIAGGAAILVMVLLWQSHVPRWLWPLVGIGGVALYIWFGRGVKWPPARDALRIVAIASVLVALLPIALAIITGLLWIAFVIVLGVLLLLLLARVL